MLSYYKSIEFDLNFVYFSDDSSMGADNEDDFDVRVVVSKYSLTSETP